MGTDEMYDLAIDILNPSRTHFPALAQISEENHYESRINSLVTVPELHCFWEFEWDQRSLHTVAAHLLNMILVSSMSGYHWLRGICKKKSLRNSSRLI